MRREHGQTKPATSVRLSPEAKELLVLLARKNGISQAAVVETLIHEKARRENLGIADSTPGQQEAARQRFTSLLEQAHHNDPGDLTPEELEREVTLAHEEARELLRARRR
jgi:predicted transcriptional regulator